MLPNKYVLSWPEVVVVNLSESGRLFHMVGAEIVKALEAIFVFVRPEVFDGPEVGERGNLDPIGGIWFSVNPWFSAFFEKHNTNFDLIPKLCQYALNIHDLFIRHTLLPPAFIQIKVTVVPFQPCDFIVSCVRL